MYSILKSIQIFKSSRHYRLSCWLMACALLFGLTLYPRYMNAQTQVANDDQNNTFFLPYIARSIERVAATASDETLFDLAWHWGDINLSPGVGGIQVTDWDGDGENELLMANSSLLFAITHRGDYHFEQVWSVPSGVAWGVIDVNDDDIREIWVLDSSGRLVAYAPYSYQPYELGRLFTDPNIEVVDSIWTELEPNGEEQLVILQNLSRQWSIQAYSTNDLSNLWHFDLSDLQGTSSNLEMAVGQVDDDTALEIVLSSGHILDPNESSMQWIYNDSFGRRIRLVDIDRDGRDEIIGSFGSYVTAFDADLKTPAWQLNNARSVDSLYIADLTSDDLPEIITGDDQWGDLHVYDVQTRERLWSVDNPEHGVSGIGIGDVDNDTELDLVWGSGWTSSGSDHLYITPVSRQSPTFAFPDYDGTYQVAALQMDTDEAAELVFFPRQTNSGYGTGTSFIIDSATGMQEPDLQLSLKYPDSFSRNSLKFLTANIDNDPYDELFVHSVSTLYLFDHTGERLLQRDFDEQLDPRWAGDIDNDGIYELISIGNSKINIHSTETLDFEWQSIAFPQGVTDLAVGDIDLDQHMEIIFHGSDSYLQAYDAQTKLLDWQMSNEQRVQAVAIGNIDSQGGLEIVTLEDDQLKFYNGQNQEWIASTFTLEDTGYLSSVQIEITHLISTTQPQLILADREHLYLFRTPLDNQPVQTFDVSNANTAWYDVDNDQHIDLFIGYNLGVKRYRARDLFRDTTPPTVRNLYPAENSDLISRNAFVEVKFSEAMDPTTLTTENIQLQANDTFLSIDIEYMPDTRILRLTPTDLLPDNQEIAAWFSPELRDLAGNGLDGNSNLVGGESSDAYTWQFTTGNGIDNRGPEHIR